MWQVGMQLPERRVDKDTWQIVDIACHVGVQRTKRYWIKVVVRADNYDLARDLAITYVTTQWKPKSHVTVRNAVVDKAEGMLR